MSISSLAVQAFSGMNFFMSSKRLFRVISQWELRGDGLVEDLVWQSQRVETLVEDGFLLISSMLLCGSEFYHFEGVVQLTSSFAFFHAALMVKLVKEKLFDPLSLLQRTGSVRAHVIAAAGIKRSLFYFVELLIVSVGSCIAFFMGKIFPLNVGIFSALSLELCYKISCLLEMSMNRFSVAEEYF
jgi:hypothetical protein